MERQQYLEAYTKHLRLIGKTIPDIELEFERVYADYMSMRHIPTLYSFVQYLMDIGKKA